MTPTCPGCIQLHGIMKHIPSWTFFQKNTYRKCCLSARIKAPFQSPLLSTLSPNIQQAAACRQLCPSPCCSSTPAFRLSREKALEEGLATAPQQNRTVRCPGSCSFSLLSFRVPGGAFVLPREGWCRAAQAHSQGTLWEAFQLPLSHHLLHPLSNFLCSIQNALSLLPHHMSHFCSSC